MTILAFDREIIIAPSQNGVSFSYERPLLPAWFHLPPKYSWNLVLSYVLESVFNIRGAHDPQRLGFSDSEGSNKLT